MARVANEAVLAEVKDAFAYMRKRLGLGRAIEFVFSSTNGNYQMAIERSAIANEAPNVWHVSYNEDEVERYLLDQDHSRAEFFRSLALHEILHLLMWDLTDLGEKGLKKADKKRLRDLNEALVRTLESLLRPLVVKCQCRSRSRRSKTSSPTSTPSSSTAPNPHTGSTSQSANTQASGSSATTAASLAKDSTMLSETTTGAAAPNDTKGGG